MRFENCEGYARGFVMLADGVTIDCGLVFPSVQTAKDWCTEKGIDLTRIRLRPLMDHRDVDWL